MEPSRVKVKPKIQKKKIQKIKIQEPEDQELKKEMRPEDRKDNLSTNN